MRDAQGNVMGTYSKEFDYGIYSMGYKLKEQNIYGSNRIGVLNTDLEMIGASLFANDTTNYYLGYKRYELSNHLGNVLSTVSDKKLGVSVTGAPELIDHYTADQAQATDYYAFGDLMSGRRYYASTTGNKYRYGFNGKENDDEVKGIPGSQQDYGMRIYDPRLGRFLSVDPLTKQYPELTPYQFASNMPIVAIDRDGLESAIEKPDGTYTTPRDGNLARGVPQEALDQFKPQGDSKNVATDLALEVAQTFIEPLYKAATGEDFEGNKVTKGGRVMAALDFAGNFNRKGGNSKATSPKLSNKGFKPGNVPHGSRDKIRTYTKKQIDEKFKENSEKCEYCDQKTNREDYRGDHRKAHAKGGRTSDENHAGACKTCNTDKSDKNIGTGEGEWTPPKDKPKQ